MSPATISTSSPVTDTSTSPTADPTVVPGPAPAEPVRVPWMHTAIILILAVPTLIFGFRFGLLDRLSSYSLRIFLGS